MSALVNPAVPPAPAGLDDPYPLDAAQLAMFRRDGYIKLKPVLFSPGDFICRKGEVGKEMVKLNSPDSLYFT